MAPIKLFWGNKCKPKITRSRRWMEFTQHMHLLQSAEYTASWPNDSSSPACLTAPLIKWPNQGGSILTEVFSVIFLRLYFHFPWPYLFHVCGFYLVLDHKSNFRSRNHVTEKYNVAVTRHGGVNIKDLCCLLFRRKEKMLHY